MPHIASISIHPIKSLAPLLVSQTRFVDHGGLEHDREYAFFDENGKVINAKRTARIHDLVYTIDWKDMALTLRDSRSGTIGEFDLQFDHAGIEEWTTEFFEMPVTFKQNGHGGFPDDLKAPGPTMISTATLEEVASWFPGLDTDQARVRFRTNLEIGDVPPFWEDRLYGAAGEVVRFAIGDVTLEGINPCQRCVVPPRDQSTGEQYPDFSQTFRRKREETLPPWANRDRFNHYYRLAINTMVPESEIGKIVRVGDLVEVL